MNAFTTSIHFVVALLAVATLCLEPVDLQADEIPTEFVSRYCIDCHSGDAAESNFRVDDLKANFPDEFDAWANVHRRIEIGDMPPADADQPSFDERKTLITSLGATLIETDKELQMTFGRRELRRLSRAEYANTLKDLLALPHLEIEEMLPPDGRSHGFQKSASALDFSHVMISRYLDVADYALRQALVRRVESVEPKTIRGELKSVKGVRDTLQTLFVQLKQGTAIPLIGHTRDTTIKRTRGNFKKRQPGSVTDPMPRFDGLLTMMNSRSNHNITVKPFKVPQSGFYKIRVHGWGMLNDHGKVLPGVRTETVAFYAKSGRLLGRCDLPPNEPTTSEITTWLNEDEPVEYLAISGDNEKFNIPDKANGKFETFKANGIALQWFEMEGPLVESWPPKSHQHLLGDLELKPTERQPNGLPYQVVTKRPQADAKELLRRFASRAYRRPVENKDLHIPMQMVRARLQENQPFIEALLAGYRAILTSPDFLLLSEQPGELDSWALATRLSCFLINSAPDPLLSEAARTGEILDPSVLREHTDRLLNDPKSERFVDHFLGDWLDLRNISLTEPDSNLYPEHNSLLTESMVEETQAFFTEMLRHNLSARHVVDSDFVTINQRLAELYGFDGVDGSHVRSVKIPSGSVRGGLLTQASLLRLTANGTTTSPVVRGTFVLSRLLGDPPPPPPPSVPAIEPDISGATTIREQLAAHRSIAQCAVCHKKIDPPGFALESFDVMGGYREKYRALTKNKNLAVQLKSNGKPVNYRIGPPIESAGELPDGSKFSDIHEFRELLKNEDEKIARNLLERLVIYATGESTSFADRDEFDLMMKSLKKNDYGVRSMIHSIVQSQMFKRK